MGKSSHKRHKHKHTRHRSRSRSPSRSKPQQSLLVLAALGDRNAVKRALKAGASPNERDVLTGATPLHEACRHGHTKVATLLLRRGADAAAADHARGDTPAHLAAAAGHLATLAAVLTSRRPPSTDVRNDAGVSIGDAAAAAMAREEVRQFARERLPPRSDERFEGWEGGGWHAPEVDEEEAGDQAGPSAATDSGWRSARAKRRRHRSPSPAIPGTRGGADDWRQRLADEFSDEEGGGWGAWGGEWHGDEYETSEQYAQRIWQEMQERMFLQRQREQAAFRQRRASEEADRASRRAAADAEARRLLEEQQRADAAWRAAVLAGQAGARRASYEAAWEFFAAAAARGATQEIHYADVPWILPDEGASQQQLQEVVLYGVSGPQEQRRRLRGELMRWHTDKFVARFGRRLAPADRHRVLARVTATSQALTGMAAALAAGGG